MLDTDNGVWLDNDMSSHHTNRIGTDPIVDAGESRRKGSVMGTFTVTVSAADQAGAVERVAKRLPEGFEMTGRTGIRSQRHLLMTVEVANTGGDVDDCWVVLTSYGMSPSIDLGSHWELKLVPQ